MKPSLPALLLAGLISHGGALAADAPQRSLVVQGEAMISAEPDIARLQFGIQQRDVSMRVARAEVVRVSREFLALTARLGIPDNKVSSSGLNIRPDYRWDQASEQQVLTGYVVQRQLSVELADLDRLGELIEGALDAGVNEASAPQLDSSRRRDLNRDALAAAVLDARATASRLAATLGLELGAVLELETTGSIGPAPRARAAAMMSEMDAAGSYSTADLHFEGRVTARFELLQ